MQTTAAGTATEPPTVIDVRFAGGPIAVDRAEFAGFQVVRIELPGAHRIPLFRHEARALAAAILIAAGESETESAL